MKKIKSVNENLIRVESESDVRYDAVKIYLRCYQRLFSCSPKLPSKFLLTNLFMTHHQFHWYYAFFFFFPSLWKILRFPTCKINNQQTSVFVIPAPASRPPRPLFPQAPAPLSPSILDDTKYGFL